MTCTTACPQSTMIHSPLASPSTRGLPKPASRTASTTLAASALVCRLELPEATITRSNSGDKCSVSNTTMSCAFTSSSPSTMARWSFCTSFFSSALPAGLAAGAAAVFRAAFAPGISAAAASALAAGLRVVRPDSCGASASTDVLVATFLATLALAGVLAVGGFAGSAADWAAGLERSLVVIKQFGKGGGRQYNAQPEHTPDR